MHIFLLLDSYFPYIFVENKILFPLHCLIYILQHKVSDCYPFMKDILDN